MAVWKAILGALRILKSRGVGAKVWEYGGMGVWEYGRMGVWACGSMGEKTKIEDRGSKIEWISIRLAMLDHPSLILKPSPTLTHPHPPTPHDQLKATLNVTDFGTAQEKS